MKTSLIFTALAMIALPLSGRGRENVDSWPKTMDVTVPVAEDSFGGDEDCTTETAIKMMSLKDCLDYAVENAAQVQVQRTKVGDARLDRRDAILTAFTPSIEASTYGYYRWGRSIDPETNTYVTAVAKIALVVIF